MISTVQTGMAAAGPNAVLRGLIWVQGETDALALADSAWYYPHFQKFVEGMRAQFSQWTANLPIIMAVMSTTNRGLQFPFIGNVREAQAFINPNTPFIARVDMENFEFFSQDMGWGPQWTHLSKNGSCAMGTEMAKEWVASGFQNLLQSAV
jgi:hypothetical protein